VAERGRSPRRRRPLAARVAERRLRLMLAALLCCFSVVLARAAYVQAIEGPHLAGAADNNSRDTIVLTAPLGDIVDRSGLPLATSDRAYSVWAYTGLVDDPASAAEELAPQLGRSVIRLTQLLSDRKHSYVRLAFHVTRQVVQNLRRHDPTRGALDFKPEEHRIYPDDPVAAQLIGATDPDGNGIAGIEQRFRRYLRPALGQEVVVRAGDGGPIMRVLKSTPALKGHTVQLTLDREIQAQVEHVIEQTRVTWKAKWATAVVLDPRTGGILAMASAPGVPPGGYGNATLAQQRIRAVADQYEPGSTFKVVTIGAALELGKVTPDTPFTVPYRISRYDKTVSDAHEHGTETLTVEQILAQSSNVGTIEIAEQKLTSPGRDLGNLLAEWIDRLGFGKLTGVDLPGEAGGAVLPFHAWSGTSILNMPIGEGVAVTPLQMASLYAAIANKGEWIQPHVLDHVHGGPSPKLKKRQLFSPQTSASLVAMLRQVVADGTGLNAQIQGYSVAGKTGTTQKVDPKTHSYCGGDGHCEYDASFVGFVPAKHPRAVVLVVVDEPQGDYYGGDVAAPAFREIATGVLQHFDVPEDAPGSVPQTTTP
jgi:cell division protein FtsI (penicillin-binding protein 3)